MERIEVAGISVEALIAGAGPPLFFLHGGDYVAQNRAFLDRLAQRFRVVMPRPPGFGNTPRPPWFRSVGDIALFRAAMMAIHYEPLVMPETAPRLGLCRGPHWDDAQPEGRAVLEAAADRIASPSSGSNETLNLSTFIL